MFRSSDSNRKLDMRVYCVRIGNKYGLEYESYINEKLVGYDVHWIKQPINQHVKLQWNKMIPMSLNYDKPICVIDIDILLMNDYKQIFEYPIKRGEFAAIPGWWKDTEGYTINGGFFKYFPIDCNYIYNEFINNVDYWQEHYIKNGTTVGPVNGEQHFVEDQVKRKLKLKYVPPAWATRWSSGYNMTDTEFTKWMYSMNDTYSKLTGNEYLHLDEFHPDIKIVHYTHSHNKPY